MTRGNKIFLVSLIVAPTIIYGVMKMREAQMREEEVRLEREGRVNWERDRIVGSGGG